MIRSSDKNPKRVGRSPGGEKARLVSPLDSACRVSPDLENWRSTIVESTDWPRRLAIAPAEPRKGRLKAWRITTEAPRHSEETEDDTKMSLAPQCFSFFSAPLRLCVGGSFAVAK